MKAQFAAAELWDLYACGKFTELIAHCREIVSDLCRLGHDTIDVAFALEDLAIALESVGDHSAALEHLKESLSIEVSCLGEICEPCLRTLLELGRIYTKMERLDAAEACLSRANVIFEHLPEAQRRGESALLIAWANLHYKRKDYLLAERLLIRAAKLRLDRYGRWHPAFVQVFDRLSVVYRYMGRLLPAERAIRKALRISQQAQQTECPIYAMMLGWLGCVCTDQGKFTEAREYITQSLEILRRVRQPGDIKIATIEQWRSELEDRVAGVTAPAPAGTSPESTPPPI